MKAVQDEERFRVLKAEAAVCVEASKGANLIVFNLFSLEGRFIAAHFDIPCIALSPHLQTRYSIKKMKNPKRVLRGEIRPGWMHVAMVMNIVNTQAHLPYILSRDYMVCCHNIGHVPV